MTDSDLCEECGDAPASDESWFNGRTLMRLCAPCWEWWKAHGLIEPRDDAFLAEGET